MSLFHYTTTREITAIWLLTTALFQLKFEIIGIYSLDDATTTKLNMVKLVKNRLFRAWLLLAWLFCYIIAHHGDQNSNFSKFNLQYSGQIPLNVALMPLQIWLLMTMKRNAICSMLHLQRRCTKIAKLAIGDEYRARTFITLCYSVVSRKTSYKIFSVKREDILANQKVISEGGNKKRGKSGVQRVVLSWISWIRATLARGLLNLWNYGKKSLLFFFLKTSRGWHERWSCDKVKRLWCLLYAMYKV